jgi:hypothetical protein
MGVETAQAWRSVLDDLVARGLRRPEFLIVDIRVVWPAPFRIASLEMV